MWPGFVSGDIVLLDILRSFSLTNTTSYHSMGFLKTLTAKPAPAGIAKPRPWYHWSVGFGSGLSAWTNTPCATPFIRALIIDPHFRFEESDTPAECKLLLKLNLLICVFAFACYWVKNLDYSNVSNAYVSGMATGTPQSRESAQPPSSP